MKSQKEVTDIHSKYIANPNVRSIVDRAERYLLSLWAIGCKLSNSYVLGKGRVKILCFLEFYFLQTTPGQFNLFSLPLKA